MKNTRGDNSNEVVSYFCTFDSVLTSSFLNLFWDILFWTLLKVPKVQFRMWFLQFDPLRSRVASRDKNAILSTLIAPDWDVLCMEMICIVYDPVVPIWYASVDIGSADK